MPWRIPVTVPAKQLRSKLNPGLNLKFSCRGPATSGTLIQYRSASILSNLSNDRRAYKPVKRRGRGPASGLGKTSGRGHKGQLQHGKVPAGFEGGQTPQHIVHGSRGFTNVFTKDITSLPIARIQSWIAQGRIDPSRPITPLQLITSRCVHGVSDGIKLLASSKRHDCSLDAQPPLSQPLHIVVSKASAKAIAMVEAAGGTVTTRYYTKDSMRRIVDGRVHSAVSLRTHPEVARAFNVAVEDGVSTVPEAGASNTHPEAITTGSSAPATKPQIRTGFPQRLPDPTSRRDLEYYRDVTRRGYLAHEVPKGDSPSLYFKTPKQRQRELNEARVERRKRRDASGAVNPALQKRTVRPGERIRLW